MKIKIILEMELDTNDFKDVSSVEDAEGYLILCLNGQADWPNQVNININDGKKEIKSILNNEE